MKEQIGQRDAVANSAVYQQIYKNIIKRSSFKPATSGFRIKTEFTDTYMTAISLIQINQLF